MVDYTKNALILNGVSFGVFLVFFASTQIFEMYNYYLFYFVATSVPIISTIIGDVLFLIYLQKGEIEQDKLKQGRMAMVLGSINPLISIVIVLSIAVLLVSFKNNSKETYLEKQYAFLMCYSCTIVNYDNANFCMKCGNELSAEVVN